MSSRDKGKSFDAEELGVLGEPHAKEQDYTDLYERIAALRETMAGRLGTDLISNPQLADALTKQIDDMLKAVEQEESRKTPPPDSGLAQLIGISPEATDETNSASLHGVEEELSAFVDACLKEIKRNRRRMKSDQIIIEQLKSETRAILSKLVAA